MTLKIFYQCPHAWLRPAGRPKHTMLSACYWWWWYASALCVCGGCRIVEFVCWPASA